MTTDTIPAPAGSEAIRAAIARMGDQLARATELEQAALIEAEAQEARHVQALADAAVGLGSDPAVSLRAAAAARAAHQAASAAAERARATIRELEERLTASLAAETRQDQDGLASRWTEAQARYAATARDLAAAGQDLWRLLEEDEALAVRRARAAGASVGAVGARTLYGRLRTGVDHPPRLAELSRIAEVASRLALQDPAS